MKSLFYGLALAAVAVMTSGHSASADDKAELNQPVPDFTLTDVVTGEDWSLSDNEGNITVLVFQSKDCPWDYMRPEAGYQRYLSPLSMAFADHGVQFVAINPNDNESVEDLAAYHQQHQIPYPLVKDHGHKVADMFDAKTTPHIFVIDGEGTLVYRGGIEEVPARPSDCGMMDEKYLEPVLVALITGQELPYTDTVSKGCTIKR